MSRPKIPVRTTSWFEWAGFRPLPLPALIPDVGHVEYRTGWRWGLVCGLVWGAMLVAVVWAVSTT